MLAIASHRGRRAAGLAVPTLMRRRFTRVLDATAFHVLTDHARARREPQLAVLSVMAHGRGEVTTATAIGVAAVKSVSRLPEQQALLDSLLIEVT